MTTHDFFYLAFALVGFWLLLLIQRYFHTRHIYRGPVTREIGKVYYTIIGPLIKLEVRRYIDSGTSFDIRNHQMGIYFETESDAKQRIQELENFNKG